MDPPPGAPSGGVRVTGKQVGASALELYNTTLRVVTVYKFCGELKMSYRMGVPSLTVVRNVTTGRYTAWGTSRLAGGLLFLSSCTGSLDEVPPGRPGRRGGAVQVARASPGGQGGGQVGAGTGGGSQAGATGSSQGGGNQGGGNAAGGSGPAGGNGPAGAGVGGDPTPCRLRRRLPRSSPRRGWRGSAATSGRTPSAIC